jgi:hypothetical protein
MTVVLHSPWHVCGTRARPACSGDQVQAWSDAVGCQWQGLAADVAVTVAVSWPYADRSHHATAAFCLVGTPEWVARQDHPARDLGRGGWLTVSVMTLFLSGFAGPRLLGGDFVRSGA